MHELNLKRNIFLFATNDMHQQNMLGLIYVSTTIVNYDRKKKQSYVFFYIFINPCEYLDMTESRLYFEEKKFLPRMINKLNIVKDSLRFYS